MGLFFAAVVGLLLLYGSADANRPQAYVVQKNGTLYLDGKPFQMMGGNANWLGLVQDSVGMSYPSRFKVDDALTTMKRMGMTFVRSQTLGISCGNAFSYFNNGTFNDTALDHIDYAVYRAGELGIRLVVPLTNNAKGHTYAGQSTCFTDWLGLPTPDDFFTNETAIGAFEDYVSRLLGHVNPHTGLKYADDPTVLMWETGNELAISDGGPPPITWTRRIAAFLKSLSGALVMDGTYGVNPEALAVEHVDVVSDHFYPMQVTRLESDIRLTTGKKAFCACEYGWDVGNNPGGSTLKDWLDYFSSTHAVSAISFWDLFPHDDVYGFQGPGDKYVLKYPGNGTQQVGWVAELRSTALNISSGFPSYRGAVGGHLPLASAPLVTSACTNQAQDGSESTLTLAWRGVAGAGNYSAILSGPLGKTKLCDPCGTDFDTPVSVDLPSSAWLPHGGGLDDEKDAAGMGQVVTVKVAGHNLDGAPGPWSAPGLVQPCN